MVPCHDCNGNTALHATRNKGNDAMPIAIVGMGYRGPGDATNIQNLYKLIAEAREAWSPMAESRWTPDAFYHPDALRNGTSNISGGHFFKHDVSCFDAPFFSMREDEASCLDPQQRLLLECGYEALENSGTPLSKAVGSKTSVFVGTFTADFPGVLYRDPETMPRYQTSNAGDSRAIISNRLSYLFDFRGPSVTIDTACSASLVAFHLACQSLRTGDADQAMVGGSSVMLNPDVFISLSAMGFLSPDGRCYSFDERAQGYARGEGVGCILLKPLEKALRDGDPIRAIVRGTGSNQDGRTPGIHFPSAAAQEALTRSVYEKTGLDPLETTYVEAHGTGTQAGDPIETGALSAVLGPNRSPDKPLKIGSVKTNVGHSEAASGVTGLVKAVLMLENKVILPSRNFKNVNKRIPLEEWKLKVATELEPWDVEGPRRLSINSFGYGGSNAHVILEDATTFFAANESVSPQPQLNGITNGATNGATNGHINGDSNYSAARKKLFLLSGFDDKSIMKQAQDLAEYLRNKQTDNTDLANLAYTLSERRSSFPWRTAVTAGSTSELIEGLQADDLRPVRMPRKATLGFIFTGQGAQWPKMGMELWDAFPVYRKSLEKSRDILNELGSSWDLLEELSKDAKESNINRAEYSQPISSALQCALVDLLYSLGITPTAVTGHSSGEIAAAYCSGMLSLDTAMAVAYFRGVVTGDLAMSGKLGVKGTMMAVALGKSEIEPLLARLTRGRAVVACENSPASVTISGDVDAINELYDLLEQEQSLVFKRKLVVDLAYHSHHMEAIVDDYLSSMPSFEPLPQTGIQMWSSVTEKLVESKQLGPQYWVANMLSMVRFSTSLAQLSRHSGDQRPVDILVEVGPHSALAGPIKQIINGDSQLRDAQITYLSALRRKQNAVDTVMDMVSGLAVRGYPVSLTKINHPVNQESLKVLVDLPPYPWNHTKSYWAESRISKAYRQRPFPRTDILGVEYGDNNPFEPRWRNVLRLSEIPWLADHKVQRNIVYPAGGFVAMAIEAATQHAVRRGVQVESYRLRDIAISQALVIPEDKGEAETIFTLQPYHDSTQAVSDVWDAFCIYSVSSDNKWTRHCRGLISVKAHAATNNVTGDALRNAHIQSCLQKISSMTDSCTKQINVQQFYKTLQALGLDYGPQFANLTDSRATKDACVAQLVIPDTASIMPQGFQHPFTVHPSTVDGMLHPIFAAISTSQGGLRDPMVPVSIKQISLSPKIAGQAGQKLDIYMSIDTRSDRQIETSIMATNEGEESTGPVVEMNGLTCVVLPNDTPEAQQGAKKHAWSLEWGLDADFLNTKAAEDLWTLAPPTVEEQSIMLALERTSLQCVAEALASLTKAQTSQLPQLIGYLAGCARTVGAKSSRQEGQPGSVSPLSPEICQKLAGKMLQGPLSDNIQPGESTYRYLLSHISLLRNAAQVGAYAGLLGFKNPEMSILETGIGSGLAVLPVLQALGMAESGERPRFAKYEVTHKNREYLELVKERLGGMGDMVNFEALNPEVDPAKQGFTATSYDLVIATSASITEKPISDVLQNLRQLLRPGGKLVLLELTSSSFSDAFMINTLPSWQAGKDTPDLIHSFRSEAEWSDLLVEAGFQHPNVILHDFPDNADHHSSMIISTTSSSDSTPDVVIIADKTESSDPVIFHLTEQLSRRGVPVVLSSPDEAPSGKICILLSEFTDVPLHNPSAVQFAFIKKVLLESAGVLWVTKGAGSSAPLANIATGIARTVRSENDDNLIVTLDLNGENELPPTASAELIYDLFQARFLRQGSKVEDMDLEHQEKNGQLMIPRVLEDPDVSACMYPENLGPKFESQPWRQPGRPLRIEVGAPGLLDSLRWVEDDIIQQNLPDESVEIEVKAAGVNFRDVMISLGQIGLEKLGGECSGVIAAVGKSVQGFEVGDRVASLLTGTFATTVHAKASSVQHIPSDMSFETAAALPVIYVTAYYSLFHLAHVRAGEKVLIHGAAGGVGQAAIELCQMLGAEIFATVGSKTKKQMLMDRFKVPEDHIFYSRDWSFAAGVMMKTDNQGVDVILNSVAGEAHRLTWNCIGPFGRFIELGKRDIFVNSHLEMKQFAKNVTFATFDLVDLIHVKPDVCGKVWGKVLDLLATGQIQLPSPIAAYPMSKIVSTLQTMQSGKHMGKLVLVDSPNNMVPATARSKVEDLFSADASYFIVGGLGGIGRVLASWMFRQGARHFIFASRSGATHPAAKAFVSELENQGSRVLADPCDISNETQLCQVITKASEEFPPIKGAINSAMVLRDTLFANMTLEEYQQALQPKVQGTLNLHNQLPKDLDFFILLSSVSGILGNTSQANYAGGNTFLDAFAAYRNRMGLAASSLDLGVVTGVGHVAEDLELAQTMARQGFEGINEEELLALVGHNIATSRTEHRRSQVVLGLGSWNESSPANLAQPMFAHFRHVTTQDGPSAGQGGGDIMSQVKSLSLEEAAERICEEIMVKVSALCQVPLEDILPSKTLSQYGMDSLIAVEMRNWIFHKLNCTVPVLELMAGSSLSVLSVKIAKQLTS